MSWIKKYLEESPGINSLMRLQSFMTVIFAFIVIVWQMIKGCIYIELDILLITAGFAPKALQKFAERGIHRKEKTDKNPEVKNE